MPLSVPNPLLIQIAQHSSDLIAVSDLDNKITFMNDAGCLMLGLEPKDWTRLTLDDMVAPAYRDMLHNEVLPTAVSAGVWEGIMQVQPRDSRPPIDVHRSTFAVRCSEGKLTGFATVAHNISEEVAERQQLLRRVETFNALIGGNPFGVYVVDADFRLAVVSRGARSVFRNIDIEAKPDLSVILRVLWNEPFASDAIGRFAHTLETGESYASHSTVEVRADIDKEEAYDWRIERIVMPDGRYGVVCYFYDLSERQQWAKELQQAREREQANAGELELLYNEAPLGLAMIDANLDFVRFNPCFTELNGLPDIHTTSELTWEILPDYRERLKRACAQVLKSGRAKRKLVVEGSTRNDPHVHREWHYHLYPVPGKEGQIGGVGIMVQDMTQQRINEETIRASEQRLRLVLDQLFAFVGLLSPEGQVTYANEPPLTAAGIQLSDVSGVHFADTPWWNYSPAVQMQLRDAIDRAKEGEVVRYDVPVQLGAHLLTIDFQLSALRNREGSVIGLVPSGVIIEDRVQAERALRNLTNQLEELIEQRTKDLILTNAKLLAEIEQREAAQTALFQSKKLEAVGRLVSGVAHDFNNILAAVLSGLSLVERKVDDPAVREILKMSVSAARRGAGLVKQMLAFARKQPLMPSYTEIKTVFEELRPLVLLSLPPDTTLTMESDEDVWPIVVDSGQLHSAILNLALNARDAIIGTGRLTISAVNCGPTAPDRPDELTRGEPQDQDFVAIKVIDTGMGMSAETLAKFAEPFFTTKTVGKGTGLGVAMVHGFVNQSGGTMLVESQEGVGTSITLYLPRAVDHVASHVHAPSSQRAQSVRRILVVDDDHDLRFITAATLMEFGFEVGTADGADKALNLLATTKFDLIITDVVMPDGDGPSLAAAVRASYPEMPIIFVSGLAHHLDLSHEIVVSKPFEAESLIEQINMLLNETAEPKPRGR
jgi:signal transduction histidine kinase